MRRKDNMELGKKIKLIRVHRNLTQQELGERLNLGDAGGNRRLALAALNNRDFVVWTGHFVSLLSVIGGWGGVLPLILSISVDR